MAHNHSIFERIYQQASHWLTDVKEHELVNIIELVEQSKQFALAAEAIPQQQVSQFIENLRYDLKEFYQLNKEDADHSLYLGLMTETFWQSLANITDQSQVEWAELTDDFEHDGIYQEGDMIGFGVIACQECKQTLTITHLTQISSCIHCGHSTFKRQALD